MVLHFYMARIQDKPQSRARLPLTRPTWLADLLKASMSYSKCQIPTDYRFLIPLGGSGSLQKRRRKREKRWTLQAINQRYLLSSAYYHAKFAMKSITISSTHMMIAISVSA
jgi:hypothetical protein